MPTLEKATWKVPLSARPVGDQAGFEALVVLPERTPGVTSWVVLAVLVQRTLSPVATRRLVGEKAKMVGPLTRTKLVTAP